MSGTSIGPQPSTSAAAHPLTHAAAAEPATRAPAPIPRPAPRPARESLRAHWARLTDRAVIAWHEAGLRWRPDTQRCGAALRALSGRMATRLGAGDARGADRCLEAMAQVLQRLAPQADASAHAQALEPILRQALSRSPLAPLVAAHGRLEAAAARGSAVRPALAQALAGVLATEGTRRLAAPGAAAASHADRLALRAWAGRGTDPAGSPQRDAVASLLRRLAQGDPVPRALGVQLCDLASRGALPLADLPEAVLAALARPLADAGIAHPERLIQLALALRSDPQAAQANAQRALQALAGRDLADGLGLLDRLVTQQGIDSVQQDLATARDQLDPAAGHALQAIFGGEDGRALDQALGWLLEGPGAAPDALRARIAPVRTLLQALAAGRPDAPGRAAEAPVPPRWRNTPVAVSQAVERTWGLPLMRQPPGLVQDLERRVAAGMNQSLREVGPMPPDAALPPQAAIDWPRGWTLDFFVQDQPRQRLEVRQGQWSVTTEGQAPRPLAVRGPGEVAALGLALGVDPQRLWRVSHLLAQTQTAGPEVALSVSPWLLRRAGGDPDQPVAPLRGEGHREWGTDIPAGYHHRVMIPGGESVHATVRFGPDQDELELELSRGNLRSVVADDDIVEVEADRTYSRWNIGIAIDRHSQARPLPGKTHFECVLARTDGSPPDPDAALSTFAPAPWAWTGPAAEAAVVPGPGDDGAGLSAARRTERRNAIGAMLEARQAAAGSPAAPSEVPQTPVVPPAPPVVTEPRPRLPGQVDADD